MHRATDARLYLQPLCLSITIVTNDNHNVPAGDGAFRFCDFWRSRRGSLSRADAAVIPRLVQPDPTAGRAVNDELNVRTLAYLDVQEEMHRPLQHLAELVARAGAPICSMRLKSTIRPRVHDGRQRLLEVRGVSGDERKAMHMDGRRDERVGQ